MEIREVRAFVAVAEAGGLSAAARGLHVSQSALSQTIRSLERQLGVQLLVRDHAGVHLTGPGEVLLREGRSLIALHDRVVAAVGGSDPAGAGRLRVGIPLELPHDLLPRALGLLAVEHPDTLLELRHASSAEQLAALLAGDLDVALVRDRPADDRVDSVPAVEESLGVLLSAERAAELAEPNGIRLHRLAGLDWISFPRAQTPAWYDQVAATLRGHGITVVQGDAVDGQPVIAEVKLAATGAGRAFALAPPDWTPALPEGVAWHPLIGDPLVRRTWAVWRADSRRRDLAALVAILDLSDGPRKPSE